MSGGAYGAAPPSDIGGTCLGGSGVAPPEPPLRPKLGPQYPFSGAGTPGSPRGPAPGRSSSGRLTTMRATVDYIGDALYAVV